jgi:hypothetical protein
MQTATVVPTKTQGTSPKTVLAACLPAIGTVVAVLLQWVITGELNRPELVTAITGASASMFAGLGAWLGHPGTVEVAVDQVVAQASDDTLPPAVVEQLAHETEPPPPAPGPLEPPVPPEHRPVD